MQEPCHGLGYTGDGSSAGLDLIKSYLNDCIDYDNEQYEVSKLICPNANNDDNIQAKPNDESNQVSKVAKGRNRAQMILQKFKQQQSMFLADESKAKVNVIEQTGLQSFRYTTDIAQTQSNVPSIYKQQRLQAKQREQERIQQSLMQNFDYITRKQKAKQAAINADYAQSQELERRAMQAKIGILHKEFKQPPKQKQQSFTESLYISSLPTNMTRLQERTLHDLFGSYGKLRKIHYYRDRQTNELKGDGLVIYAVNSAQEGKMLQQSVCMQLNGAELPEGIVLRVEPSTKSYKEESVKVTDQATKTTGQTAATHSTTKTSPDIGNEEDLDDFFQSLE